MRQRPSVFLVTKTTFGRCLSADPRHHERVSHSAGSFRGLPLLLPRSAGRLKAVGMHVSGHNACSDAVGSLPFAFDRSLISAGRAAVCGRRGHFDRVGRVMMPDAFTPSFPNRPPCILRPSCFLFRQRQSSAGRLWRSCTRELVRRPRILALQCPRTRIVLFLRPSYWPSSSFIPLLGFLFVT